MSEKKRIEVIKDKKMLAISLPSIQDEGKKTLHDVLQTRRSIRSYKDKSITLEQLSQLLWAAQGITNKQGFRTAPSAGALYPMELYIVVGNVKDLVSGVYKYDCRNHTIKRVTSGDLRQQLAHASLGQSCVHEGAVALVVTAVYERTRRKYGDRAVRYVHMEAGHIAQNVCLQAVALKLGTVTVGAFDDDRVQDIIGAHSDEKPLYILPIGVV